MFEMKPMHQPQAGERAGTSRGHHVKIVLESPGARLCRTMITRGGGREMIMRRTEVIVRRIMPALGKSRDYTYTF